MRHLVILAVLLLAVIVIYSRTSHRVENFDTPTVEAPGNFTLHHPQTVEPGAGSFKHGGPSPASGDYGISSSILSLFSQVSPTQLADALQEGFTPAEGCVDGYEALGTLFSSPYSDSEGFSNLSENGVMAAGDPYGTCRRRYGTSDWPSYSQCVRTGEGMV